MGNYKFRLSDMMPNAWFYKLRDNMSRSRSRNRKHATAHPVKKKPPSTSTSQRSPLSHTSTASYYHHHHHFGADNPKASDNHFPDPPRTSSKKRGKRKTLYNPFPTLVTSSVSPKSNSIRTRPQEHSSLPQDLLFSSESDHFHECTSSEFDAPDSFARLASCSSSFSACKVGSSNTGTDIIFDLKDSSSRAGKIGKPHMFDTDSEPELPPILTNPTDDTKYLEPNGSAVLSIKTTKEAKARVPSSTSWSTGVKLRTNSPRLASKKIQAHGRRSVSSKSRRRSGFSQSFAIVKSSFDPQRDFRDSMMEMIVENNIQASKDLEELLACYLSLNSNEYHDHIVKAFEQIWFDISEPQV